MLAKRPLYVSIEDLKKLLNIPEEIEIISVSEDGTNVGITGFTFLLASAGEVEGITRVWNQEQGVSNVRRIGLQTLKELQEGDKQNG